jgi:hypothetical protein
MMSMKLRIVDVSRDGVNGHLSVHAMILEELADGNQREGALETFGIDPLALQKRFEGSIGKWLAWVGRQMKDNHRRRTMAHADLHGLKGKTIDLGD